MILGRENDSDDKMWKLWGLIRLFIVFPETEVLFWNSFALDFIFPKLLSSWIARIWISFGVEIDMVKLAARL